MQVRSRLKAKLTMSAIHSLRRHLGLFSPLADAAEEQDFSLQQAI